MKLPRPTLLVLALAALAYGEGPPPAPEIRVAGLAVVRETVDATEAEPYMPFGLEKGTCMSLILRLPERRIVSFDQGESSVESIVDDKGTNLMAISHRLQVPGFLGHGCGIVKNGQLAHVEIFGGTPPAGGATLVKARGNAVLFTGSHVAKITTTPVKAEKDAEILADGVFRFQLARWEPGGIGGKGANLTLRLEVHPAAIAGVRFFDGEGNPVESRPAGMAVEKVGDKRVFLLHHQLAAMPENLAMEIDHWSDLQRVDVPFDVKAGLGDGL